MPRTTKINETHGKNHDEDSSDFYATWPEENTEKTCQKSMPQILHLWYSQWTFSFMNRVLAKGSQQMRQQQQQQQQHLSPTSLNDDPNNNEHLLSLQDLYKIPSTMECPYLIHKFHTTYQQRQQAMLEKEQQQQQQQQKQQQQQQTDDDDSDGEESSYFRPLVKTLWTMASPDFIPAGYCQLLTVLCQIAIPLCVRELLVVLEESYYDGIENNNNNDVIQRGMPWVILIFAASVLNAFGTYRHRYLANKAGVTLRATLVGVIYDHSLKLTPQGRKGLTTGTITNLVAIDTHKLFEVTQEGHLIWSCPLSMILVTICLLIIFGPTTIVGMLLLFLFVPLVEKIATRMLRTRRKRVTLADQRVEITNAMLQGIKVTKLNNYESRYSQRLLDVRSKEIKYLFHELCIWCASMVMTVITPGLASAVTFATYVLVSESNILTVSDTFTVLFLFSALRFPINYAGRLIGRLAQAIDSTRRLAHFLSRDIRTTAPPATTSNNSNNKDTHGMKSKLGKGNEQHQHSEQSSSLTHNKMDDISILSMQNATFYFGNDGDSNRGGSSNVSSGRTNHSNPGNSYHQSDMGDDDDDLAKKLVCMTHDNGDDDNDDDNHSAMDDIDSTNTSVTTVTPFRLSNINLPSLQAGEILAVVGPVGSGKSTLIQGIIGEVPSSSTTVVKQHGKISYASQIPFILNTTVKENILFGLPYDKDLYEEVLDVCCLRQDLELIGPAKDDTEIGERGVTLSGGQKQRVSLARATYSQPDLLLCDDPLSALDANTAKTVFERLFKSSNSITSSTTGNGANNSNKKKLLEKTAVVLVTHASHFLNRVDHVMVIVDGSSRFLGTWDDMTHFHSPNQKTMAAIESIRSAVQESENEDDQGDKVDSHATKKSSKKKKKSAPSSDKDKHSGELMTVEEREHGLTSLRTWIRWFYYAGGPMFLFFQIFFMALDRFSYIAAEWWLTKWTSAAEQPIEIFGISFDSQTEGRSAQYKFLAYYAVILAVSCFFAIWRTLWAAVGGVRCAKKLYLLMLHGILHAPMSYFDTTPLGRILNRFTFDIEVLDITLTQSMTIFMISISWLIASICIMCSILPWIILAIIPVTVAYVLLLLHFRRSGADLQRLDVVTRSPIQAMLSEGLDGAATIRVFQQEEHFEAKFQHALDKNSSAQLNFIAAHNWLGVRIELLGSTTVLASCLLAVCLNDVLNIDPGLVALLIIWSSNFTISLSFIVQSVSENEAALTSLERVFAMTVLPQEKPMKTSTEKELPPEWPQQGLLEFQNVRMRYREGLPLALNDLTFTVPPGRRCGVVGRTGAGKTTITTALFRLVEIESGCIILDGVDLASLGLSDVRGRPNGLSIIPQDPVLFAGTLRECLDPFGLSSNTEIFEALVAVRFAKLDQEQQQHTSTATATSANDPIQILESIVEEGGSNFSVGERQLLCLARALLNKPKLLVMDEATASVDGETDAFIQRMLRTRFQDTTLLTIAHRLHTIMDYDLVLVMDEGRAAQFGSPHDLLQHEDGLFTSLVNSTGEESARALKEMIVLDGGL